MPKWVMVLNDGTTFTDLDGCAIVAVPDEMPDDEVEEFVKHSDGYLCFGDQPGVESNNGQTLDDLLQLDRDYYDDNWRRLGI